MGKRLYKVQQLFKCRLVDLHRNVPGIKYDAMLIVVDIGAVLQAPVLAAHFNGNNPVICPGRVVHTASVALVLHTQLALGIGCLGCILGSGNGLGVLFRLTEVYGNIQLAIFACIFPAHILFDPVTANIVGITGEFIVPVRGLYRIPAVLLFKCANHFPGHGRDGTHNTGIKNVLGGDAVITQALFHGVIQQTCQNFLQILGLRLVGGLVIVFTQDV